MKIEVGMYVRTKHSGICKIYREFSEASVDVGIGVLPEINGFFIDKEEVNYIERKDILKASFNIIDLIEEGDYVNSEKVLRTNCKLEYVDDDSETGVNEVDNGLELETGWIYFEYEVQSIVTKEQFESIEYRIGEKV